MLLTVPNCKEVAKKVISYTYLSIRLLLTDKEKSEHGIAFRRDDAYEHSELLDAQVRSHRNKAGEGKQSNSTSICRGWLSSKVRTHSRTGAT